MLPVMLAGGSRLNEISRHVRVKDKTIAQITKMSIGDAENYYQDLNLEGAKGEIADKIFKEIREPSALPCLCWSELFKSCLVRQETLSGGEAQRIRSGFANRCRFDRCDVCP